jgi:two-component system NtrC family response regulator
MAKRRARKESKGDGAEKAPRPGLLVVDDDAQIIKQIEWALGDEYTVRGATNRAGALRIFRRGDTPVVLLDLGLPPRPREPDEGLAALAEILAEDPLAKIIVVSGQAERKNALEAVQRGAFDIFPKPVDLDQLRVVLARVYQRLELERGVRAGPGDERCEGILGSSPPMRALYATIRKVAPSGASVLIAGESGTGKELVARAIHSLSPQKDGPFVPIDCGSIPEGLLESEIFGHEKGAFTGATATKPGKTELAQGGTLFLDEIGEMPLALQVKLLRFLQERVIERVGGREPIPVDARIITATNRDLEQEVREGRFREDLFFRLAVLKMELPALRERGADVELLAQHFTEEFARELGRPVKRLAPDALEAIQAYPWPGNVRELQNRLKRAVVLAEGPVIGQGDLGLDPSAPEEPAEPTLTLKEAREKLERDLVVRAIEKSDGNVSKAARVLGISRPTLYELMDRFGLPRPSRKS